MQKIYTIAETVQTPAKAHALILKKVKKTVPGVYQQTTCQVHTQKSRTWNLFLVPKLSPAKNVMTTTKNPILISNPAKRWTNKLSTI